MKISSSPRLWRAVLVTGIIGTTVPFWMAPGRSQTRTLQIWPGQRVVLVLPVTLGADWNADKSLGDAILQLVQPEVGRAMTRTGKFSPTLPYYFDPILRRALLENRASDETIKALVATPSLDTAQPVLKALSFDQPAMIADVKLEELRIGGTAKSPTVQLQMSGRLYENRGDTSELFRTVVVTSRPFGGKTPEARLQAAAAQGLLELAQLLVEPPEAFSLPLPPTPTPAPAPTARPTPAGRPVAPGTPATPATGTAGTGTAATGTAATGTGVPLTAAEPGTGTAPVASPNLLAPQQGGAFVPQLPPGQPPLGLAVPDEPVGAR